jgi:hypothetical protein
LPEEPVQTAAAAWAFRETPGNTTISETMLAHPVVAEPAPAEPVVARSLPAAEVVIAEPSPSGAQARRSDSKPADSQFSALFIPAATFGVVAIGAGVFAGVVFLALEAMSAPARLARSLMRIGQN